MHEEKNRGWRSAEQNSKERKEKNVDEVTEKPGYKEGHCAS